jgi:uncharacterized protein (DUF2336 family)
MQTAPSLIDDLEAAIHSGSAERRAEMLRSVTDLFLGNAEQYNHEQVDLFGDVLNLLIEQVEKQVLPELSRRLAPVEVAPRAVVQKLARHDDVAVAAPVLSQSPLLSDHDLIEIAEKQGQEHLSAISERKRIAAAVTDILVERGDTSLLRKLTQNDGASFSQAGFGVLTRRAETDEQLTETLALRADLPPQLLEQLMTQATEAVRNRLAARLTPSDQEILKRILPLISERTLRAAAPVRDFRLAETIVDKLQESSELNEAAVADFAHKRRYEEMTVGLARMCSAPITLLDRLMQNPRYDGILVACKSSGLHWPTFKAILASRFSVQPTTAEFERARSDFLKLSAATAQRMFRFWLVRGLPN